ncbi:peptidyl-prolyl cis-trans isomerase FKBP53-like [Punica granatum]|uniref:Peptidyl-prolyl cis-trans isomerase FKBP53-like n=1 Tax=Punica granatum TaxID=22663 RepID=A0A6P8BYH7_PUNGR|nr:peptidyl-prolyl cis-trans isomerase FKBP53-like [Punica granatum]XP_031375365.1 peptidyl-prolyl cis-trans isomerase FKBP53-like [Punica granatum]XP_031375371.1 peptidyl-prolyl cis-trans isomerase FKBP53-like [Punica granatum]
MENSQSKQQKKNKQNGPVENPQQGQIVPRNSASVPVLESEDEDGFPISKNASEKKSEEAAEQVDNDTNEKVLKKKKRNVKTIEQDDQSDRQKKGKKQKKLDKEGKNDKELNEVMDDRKELNEVTNGEAHQVLPQEPPDDNNENQAEKKKKNKKSQDSGDQQSITKGEKEEKPSQVRTFPNGMVVEELAMGELQKNGEIFDSNVGRAPSKFHLSIGQVIKGGMLDLMVRSIQPFLG